MVAEGVVRAGRFGGSARVRGCRPSPTLLTPYGWWLRAQVSREAPPLPGGYRVGEKVFWTGANQTLSNGEKLVHGQQGEVVGPGTGEDGDKRVSVLFPGNKGNINCLLTTVRRLRAASAATPRLRPTAHTRRCPRPVRPGHTASLLGCIGLPQPSAP